MVHIRPVQFLKPWVAVKTVVDAWDGGSPHQNYDAEVVKLNVKGLDFGTVIGDNMESRCLIIGNRWAVVGRIAYVVDKKKQIETPWKKVEKTTTSNLVGGDWRRYKGR